MSYSIITYGFGSYGSDDLIPTYGFYSGAAVISPDVLVDIEVDVIIVRTINFMLDMNTQLLFDVVLS